MIIAYLSIDPVNVAFAEELCGPTLCVLEPRDHATRNSVAAVLYDLDSLPTTFRAGLLAELLAGAAAGAIVGVHSYNLDEAQIDHLTSNGVIISRCLTENLFGDLRWAGVKPELRNCPARPTAA